MNTLAKMVGTALGILSFVSACGGKGGGAGTSGATTTSTTGGGSTSTGSGAMLNGCTLASADAQTNKPSVDITAIKGWSLPHQVCIKVSPGTQLSITGDFKTHPITGGDATKGKSDGSNPFTAAENTVNGKENTSFDPDKAKLTSGSVFPYYCLVHTSQMQGVVYVE